MNSLFVIEPYRHAGTWVFDDARVDLKAEPFIAGIPEMIDRLIAPIEGSENGFRLIFSASNFPGAQLELTREHEEVEGWWYRADAYDAHGWLCPALFKYFDEAPEGIWVRAESLSSESLENA